jgi:aspartate aminotransferase
MALYLLEEAHVATVSGDAFGAPGYFRMSYATSEDNIRKAMQRIAEALAKLK